MNFFKTALLTTIAASALMAVPANAADLNIINNTGVDIHAVYISSSGTNDWEENVIDGNYLPNGNEFTVNIHGSYNKFDLRIEDKDGNSQEYYEFPGSTNQIELQTNGKSQYQY